MCEGIDNLLHEFSLALHIYECIFIACTVVSDAYISQGYARSVDFSWDSSALS